MDFGKLKVTILYLNIFLFTSIVTKVNAVNVTSSVKPSGRPATLLVEGSFHLSLQFQDGYHFCSAALYERYVLSQRKVVHFGITAAHCFQHKIHPVFAVAGLMDLTNNTGTLQRRLITKIHLHPGFDPRKRPIDNDIALVRFESNFVTAIGSAVEGSNQLAVNVFFPILDNNTLNVQGWGKMFPGWSQENVLQVFESKLINGTDCQNPKVTNTKWRAGDFNPTNLGCYFPPTLVGPGDCHGDAGAIVTDRTRYRRRVIGVVTFGHDCYYPDTPGVFTWLYKHAIWMSSVMNMP